MDNNNQDFDIKKREEAIMLIKGAKRTRKSRHESNYRIRQTKDSSILSQKLCDLIGISVGDFIFLDYEVKEGKDVFFISKGDALNHTSKLLKGNKFDSSSSEALQEIVGEYTIDVVDSNNKQSMFNREGFIMNLTKDIENHEFDYDETKEEEIVFNPSEVVVESRENKTFDDDDSVREDNIGDLI